MSQEEIKKDLIAFSFFDENGESVKTSADIDVIIDRLENHSFLVRSRDWVKDTGGSFINHSISPTLGYIYEDDSFSISDDYPELAEALRSKKNRMGESGKKSNSALDDVFEKQVGELTLNQVNELMGGVLSKKVDLEKIVKDISLEDIGKLSSILGVDVRVTVSE